LRKNICSQERASHDDGSVIRAHSVIPENSKSSFPTSLGTRDQQRTGFPGVKFRKEEGARNDELMAQFSRLISAFTLQTFILASFGTKISCGSAKKKKNWPSSQGYKKVIVIGPLSR